jgi:chromosome segregation protein
LRLTHLKLAGFKSFVDATTLHIHGQRVGVVGPNGCGKSNVMESVRWVLGESSAKEMRGDNMDAVIFNGSGKRKPISRASVELIFDNSMGGASGEWSQYAEISVKRVIERDKGSTYYINNTTVRRRDVADLFLGTGLGGRAYAIIGQNTINRIVEAKPEELRIFLEEAAGISKYKERRRETELRLRDTRDNLLRVEDILRELDKLIVRLQSQALVAEQYHRLQDALNMTKGQIWLLKKRHASSRWEKAQLSVQKQVNELEAQIASLRSTESALEKARQQHVDAAEALSLAQASYYAANAELSNLENQLKNTSDARARVQAQLQQLNTQLTKNQLQHDDFHQALQLAETELLAASADLSSAELNIKLAADALPLQAQAMQQALAVFNSSQAAHIQAEQHLRLEQANSTHRARLISEKSAQLARVQQSLSSLQLIADDLILEQEAQLTATEAEVSAVDATLSTNLQQQQAQSLILKSSRDLHFAAQRELSLLEAEIVSLAKIQTSIANGNNAAALSTWLKDAGLDHGRHLWQTINIEAGWETAVEAALGARLNAITGTNLPDDSRPPAALALAIVDNSVSAQNLTASAAAANSIAHNPVDNKVALYSVIENIDADCVAVLQDWLAHTYRLEDHVNVAAAIDALRYGECLVNRQGDIYTRHSVTYFAAQSQLHGVLERQALLQRLQLQQPALQQNLANMLLQQTQAEQSLSVLRNEQQTLDRQLKMLTQQAYQHKLSLQQQRQQQTHALQQQKTLAAEAALANEQLLQLQAEQAVNTQLLHDIEASLAPLKLDKAAAEANKQALDLALDHARKQLQLAEHKQQEKSFNLKLITNNINDLNSKLNISLEENSALKLRISEAEAILAASKMEALRASLEAALEHKYQQEQLLTSCRNTISACEAELQQQERNRMQYEQLLHPLRDKLEASRLAEQESRLSFEQCVAELAQSLISESLLAENLPTLPSASESIKIADLEKNKATLEHTITDLGAVNLAAIDELQSELTRKQYLHSQCLDLREASNTLEEAIRKIDRETRSRLQATFDEANRHFNELFSTLFGGGQARLELLGEEILDTGMQVFAQPPGKKNSTIHLLSGGEKALTALALVFALFKLNPAPFCLMDEVDAPLDDSNTERFCEMVKKMSEKTQFLYVSHNKITMEMAQQLIGVTMQESGVSRIVDVDMEAAVSMAEELIA